MPIQRKVNVIYKQNRTLGKKNTLEKQYKRKFQTLSIIISKWTSHQVTSRVLGKIRHCNLEN